MIDVAHPVIKIDSPRIPSLYYGFVSDPLISLARSLINPLAQAFNRIIKTITNNVGDRSAQSYRSEDSWLKCYSRLNRYLRLIS